MILIMTLMANMYDSLKILSSIYRFLYCFEENGLHEADGSYINLRERVLKESFI